MDRLGSALGDDPIAALIMQEQLGPAYRAIVDGPWQEIAARIAARAQGMARPVIIGVAGSQGSGKTSLCRFMELLLGRDYGIKAATLSIDDLYLTKAERRGLAANVHPLLATRGVPGTHDVALGAAIFAAFLAGEPQLRLPRFDKAMDDRAPAECWPVAAGPLDVLLFEGWCVGARPEPPEQLVVPVNGLEAAEDADGRWRRGVNAALTGPYCALFDRLDMLIALIAPGFEAVAAWRQEQERKLRARTGRRMSPAEVERFVAHYERLTRSMLNTLPQDADVIAYLGEDHGVANLRFSGR
ncbi:kinase [Novosphingobium sp. Chol11]|uniref:kinase n=1 Tax=Novosphingobium sp. Chol11 TaxID=1385763 RepID=UPI0025E8C557|nr:kinase [Novosphingobium sp. Chol11]